MTAQLKAFALELWTGTVSSGPNQSIVKTACLELLFSLLVLCRDSNGLLRCAYMLLSQPGGELTSTQCDKHLSRKCQPALRVLLRMLACAPDNGFSTELSMSHTIVSKLNCNTCMA